jgi:hypothetical protein
MRYGTRNMGLGIVHPQKGGLVKQVNINPQLQYRYKQVMNTSSFSFKKTTHYHKSGRQQCNSQWLFRGILSQKEEKVGIKEKKYIHFKAIGCRNDHFLVLLQHCSIVIYRT